MKRFRGLSEHQQEAFGNIAINNDRMIHPKTAAVLVGKGLIVEYTEQMSFNDGLPPMHVKRYYVPHHVHIEWCEWCDGVLK